MKVNVLSAQNGLTGEGDRRIINWTVDTNRVAVKCEEFFLDIAQNLTEQRARGLHILRHTYGFLLFKKRKEKTNF